MAIFPLLIGALAALGTPPADDAELLRQAETAFRQAVSAREEPAEARRHFRAAAGLFEELTRRDVATPGLYRNLGNAYLLADDLPHAILACRHGLRLDPDDSELQDHLAFAREQVVYPSPGAPGRPAGQNWTDGLPHLGRTPRSLLLLVSYALAWPLLTRWLMTRRPGLLAPGVVAISMVLVLAAGFALDRWQQADAARHPAVVLAQDGLVLRTGNGFSYPPRFPTPLNRGVEARLLFSRGPWDQIELAGGEVGWVPRDQLLVDAP